MSSPYLGEIRPFGFNFAPRGWLQCSGQLIAISQNTALFSLLGTYYGGNGSTTFAIPNLQATAALGMGQGAGLSNYTMGQAVGAASVTLTTQQMPMHTHGLNSGILSTPNAAQNVAIPTNAAFLGLSGPNNTYSDTATPNTTFSPTMLAPFGSSSPHENRQPYLGVIYCIATQGVYPSRN